MTNPTASAEFPVWGGHAVIAVTERPALPAAVDAVRATVARFDAACSSFRDDSELSALNAAGGQPLPVSPTLREAVAAALRAARLTDGDVDPTVGEALVAFGFIPGAGSGQTPEIRAVPGWRAVELDHRTGTIRVPLGVRLDLGATAKALAADEAAAAASDASGCGVLVSLSGDIALRGEPPQDGWRIRVTDDHRSSAQVPGQWIALRSGGLATSSTTVRRDGAVHHLIDPRSGGSAAVHFRTVSVAAGSCLDANIASTAAIIRGEPSVAWLAQQGLPARLVLRSGQVQHVAGWPAGGEELELVATTSAAAQHE